jgi:hypothetical protein
MMFGMNVIGAVMLGVVLCLPVDFDVLFDVVMGDVPLANAVFFRTAELYVCVQTLFCFLQF